jgi:hypothetical protein
VGAAATAVAAIAALITAVNPWVGNGDGGSRATPPTSTQPEGIPDRLVYSATFDEPVAGWDVGPQLRNCSASFEPQGYVLTVDGVLQPNKLYPYCVWATNGVYTLTALATVRVEADAAFTELPPRPHRSLGYGDIGLRCRGRGPSGDELAYYSSITTNGAWAILRTEKSDNQRLITGERPDLGFVQGQFRRLRFDCVEQEDGAVRLVFYVDGERIGAFTDALPHPPGDVALTIAATTKGTASAAYRDLEVYTP